MNALEFPIEALDFNYLSYSFLTAINRLCAWLVVVSTTVTFWRVKSQPALPDSIPEPLLLETSVPSETQNLLLAPKTISPFHHALDGECNMGVKFTHYYHDVCESEVDNVCEDGEEDVDSGEMVSENAKWCYEDLKDIIRVRMGDFGWYRSQDLTVLDGNVVRLWDGDRQQCNTVSASLVYDDVASVW